MDNHNACEAAWLNGYKAGREGVEKKGPIDVAIVVRCKDCKWTNGKESIFAPGFMSCSRVKKNQIAYVKPDDFCSYGERKNNGQK
jgi:hypothetical protein